MGIIRRGPLTLFVDTGSVYLHSDDGDNEYLGHIDDPGDCPFDHIEDWAWLAAEIDDRRTFADACERTALASYYERLSPVNLN